jgi:enoyl-CoA hydratase
MTGSFPPVRIGQKLPALTPRRDTHFPKMGHEFMQTIDEFPAPVAAAISGYGGGLDLALARHFPIASPHAVFGHRAAALGLIPGWGGTER